MASTNNAEIVLLTQKLAQEQQKSASLRHIIASLQSDKSQAQKRILLAAQTQMKNIRLKNESKKIKCDVAALEKNLAVECNKNALLERTLA